MTTEAKMRSALHIVIDHEKRRRGLTFKALAAKISEGNQKLDAKPYAITEVALFRRQAEDVPTMKTIDLIAPALDMTSGELLELMRLEIEDAKANGRTLAGNGQIKGEFSL